MLKEGLKKRCVKNDLESDLKKKIFCDKAE